MKRSRMKNQARSPYNPSLHSNQMLFGGKKTAGIIMAIPFVCCFSLFGVFNIIAGTFLVVKACKNKLARQSYLLVETFFRDVKHVESLDPMKAVGTILLVTGCMFIVVGILLGIVACRSSTSYDSRQRNSNASFSGIQLSSANGPTSVAALSTTAGSFVSGRSSKSKLTVEGKRSVDSMSPSNFKVVMKVENVDEVTSSFNEAISINEGDENLEDPKRDKSGSILWLEDTASSTRSFECSPFNKNSLRKISSSMHVFETSADVSDSPANDTNSFSDETINDTLLKKVISESQENDTRL